MKVQTQWVATPTLLITLEHEWRRATISSEEAFEVLDKYLSAGSHVFKYVLKDGSILDIFHTNQSERDAALNRLFTEYLPELWAEFGHRAQPFTPVEPWLPGILEQL